MLRRLLAPCAPGEVSGQLVGFFREREEKVVGDGAKCLLVSSSELLRSGHVDASTGLGSLGIKVECTQWHAQNIAKVYVRGLFKLVQRGKTGRRDHRCSFCVLYARWQSGW